MVTSKEEVTSYFAIVIVSEKLVMKDRIPLVAYLTYVWQVTVTFADDQVKI